MEKEIKKILEDPSIDWLYQCLGMPLTDLNVIIESVDATQNKDERTKQRLDTLKHIAIPAREQI